MRAIKKALWTIETGDINNVREFCDEVRGYLPLHESIYAVIMSNGEVIEVCVDCSFTFMYTSAREATRIDPETDASAELITCHIKTRKDSKPLDVTCYLTEEFIKKMETKLLEGEF